jgi:hypothetical protein
VFSEKTFTIRRTRQVAVRRENANFVEARKALWRKSPVEMFGGRSRDRRSVRSRKRETDAFTL